MTYFTNIRTLDELKKAYRKLAAKFHPDNSGSKEEMQALNAEYETLFAKVKNIRSKADGTTYEKETNETPEMFKNIINAIINLNVTIDIVGSWVWVTGNTYAVKTILKEAGFKWANKKKAWYWHSEENTSNNRRYMSLDEIKNLHGCNNIKTEKELITLA